MYFEKGTKVKNESNSHIYEIESKIGQGAYGKVYRVSRVDDLLDKQEYYIKNIKLNSF
jgi:serine/threonine protein kinase